MCPSKSSYTVWLQNIIAGLTVSFVALSLGAAFGVLSERGAFAGMLSAALIAFVTSLLGGTRVQCSGPTAPMTAITAVVVAFAYNQMAARFPELVPDHFVNIVFFLTAGLLVLMGVLRLGRFITLVPNVVVSGFMNGIAVLIWVDQVCKLFDLGSKKAFEGPVAQNVVVAIATAALAFSIPWITRRWLPKFGSLLSATLLAIVIMTAASNVLKLPIEHVSLTASLKSFGDLTTLVSEQWPTTWSWPILLAALPFALQLSVLAYLDTLLTSLVVDQMTKEKTQQNRELCAQGIASAVIAFVGGIAGAQATIRSVLIVKENATMRLAGVLVGVFALIEIILLQDMINLIPQAVFAGILFKVGYDVFDWTPLRLYLGEWVKDRHQLLHPLFSRHDDQQIFVTNREFLVISGTTLVTLFWNLNVAVLLFTAIFYLHNWVFPRQRMRDLKPVTETEGVTDED